MKLEYTRVVTWPQLAWLARCTRETQSVQVFHGRRVETRKDWFCEGAWDGPWLDGDIDRTDIVTGSGARMRDGGITFVPSGSTVDRLQYFDDGHSVWISNSFACLAEAADLTPPAHYGDYVSDFRSITNGYKSYRRETPTNRGPVVLQYVDNLRWDGARLESIAKPWSRRDFSSFARYRAFLGEALRRLAVNATDRARSHPFRLASTVSSGYDSPTVTTLAREAGLAEAMTFSENTYGEPDSGLPIITALGLTPKVCDRTAWRTLPMPEADTLAADAHGWDVIFSGLADFLQGKMLLTGYHGDKVWSRDNQYLGDDFPRGDVSGLSLSEVRLGIGFLNCPVPFLGAQQAADILRISQSPEMKPWDVAGDYSRPICRRIVEEAGVPREAFGMKKHYVVQWLQNHRALTKDTEADLRAWFSSKRGEWLGHGRIPPDITRRLLYPVQLVLRILLRVMAMVPFISSGGTLWIQTARAASFNPESRAYFPWAVARARTRYTTDLLKLRPTKRAHAVAATR